MNIHLKIPANCGIVGILPAFLKKRAFFFRFFISAIKVKSELI